MANKEAAIQKWVRDQLDSDFGTDCVYLKYPAGQYSTRGISDLIFCIKGKYVAIEVKQVGGKLTKLQQKFIESINKAGGYATVIYGKDMFVINNVVKYINHGI